jgi:seryl-tRNA synthetase
MIDLGLLREDTKRTIALMHKKDPSYDAQLLYDQDKALRTLSQEVESLRHQKNELANQARAGITPEIREQSIQVGSTLKSKEAELVILEQQFRELYLSCPNLLASDVPEGNKESNQVVKEVGSKPHFNFEVKHHLELGNALGWFDFEAAAAMTGSNFPLYKKDAVKLMYALTMYMLKNNMTYGYEPVLPPAMVNASALELTGNFPKFKDQVYEIAKDNLYATPTAEVNIASMYRNQILSEQELPIRVTAWTSCFRREAGHYGALERGLIRVHQFEKVELYALSTPETSGQEQDRMIACAENILQQLGLHYRISLLAAQDCSFASAKTYDIEAWLPGQRAYYEVSSVSNCTDFQSRRGMIRYKGVGDKKATLVHTLNGSSLALSRLMVAIMEVYQQADGSIAIPDILKREGIFI